MTYFLTKQLCSQFQVENLLEEDPDPKKTRELKIYDLFHSDRGQLRRLAEEKKVPIQNVLKLQNALRVQLLGEGVSLYDIARKSFGTVTIRCGSVRLNELLVNLPSLRTIDVYGPHNSGKSHLVCSLAFQSALAGTHVFFIDTDLTFCWRERFPEVFTCSSILSRITVVPIFDFTKLIAFLDGFSRLENSHNSLLIIDSLSTILYPEKSDFAQMNRKQRKYAKELIVWQFFEAFKCATSSTFSVGVFTRPTAAEKDRHLSDVLCEANLQLELTKKEEESSTMEVNIINRTCKRLANCPRAVTIEMEELIRQNVPVEDMNNEMQT